MSAVLAEILLQEIRVELLDDGVEADVLIVDEQSRVGFARRRNAEVAEEQHAQTLAHVGRILRVVAQQNRLEAEKRLTGRVVIESDLETRLVRPATPAAVRLDR